jgi:hypothetical protein
MFGEEFIRSQGAPFDHDGRLVYATYRRIISPRTVLRVEWQRSRPSPVQGIGLMVKGGPLLIAGQRLREPILWRDTAPDKVLVAWEQAKDGELKVWNCWRDHRGTTQAWVGNAGMLVEDTGATVILRCNSRPQVTFEDLIVGLTFDHG